MDVLRKRRRRHVKKYIVIFAICGLFFVGMQLLFAGAKAYKNWDELVSGRKDNGRCIL